MKTVVALLLLAFGHNAAAVIDDVPSAAVRQSFTTDASPDLAFGASIPAGALLKATIYESADETTTISSVTDNVNGAWTLLSGPADHSNTTMRTWTYCFANSGAGSITVTVNLSGAISTQVAIAAFSGASFAGGQACGADAVGTPRAAGGAGTTYTSNSITLSGAGAIISDVSLNTQSAITPSTDEVDVTASATTRVHIVMTTHASGTSRTHVLTGSSTTSAQHIAAWLEAGGGGGSAVPAIMQQISANDDHFDSGDRLVANSR